jgi:hypothetical protein
MITLASDHEVPLRSLGLNLRTTCRQFKPMDIELTLEIIYYYNHGSFATLPKTGDFVVNRNSSKILRRKTYDLPMQRHMSLY